MPAYLNADGLYWKSGQTEGVAGNAGEFNVGGNTHYVEYEIDLVSLTSTAAILDDNVSLPVGARIEEVVVIGEVAATSGGSATLNVGLIRTDRSTNLSDTALVSAYAFANYDANGEENVLRVGSTGAGSAIGTTNANVYYVTAKYGTAAFTAGRVILRVRWYKP